MFLYAHRSMASHTSSQHMGPMADWFPFDSTSRCPTSTGDVHKSMTCSCVFMLVQLNKCVVVYGSDLQRGHSGDGCLTSLICLDI